MAQDFNAEVNISYEKTLANMKEFESYLKREVDHLHKANRAIDSYDNNIEMAAEALRKMSKEQKNLTSLYKKSVNEAERLVNVQKRENDQLDKLSVKYGVVSRAMQAYKNSERELKRLKDSSRISNVEYNRLLDIQKRKLIETGMAAKTNASANKLLAVSIKEVSLASRVSQAWVSALHKTWKAFFALMAAQTLGRWTKEFAQTGENIELMSKKLEILTGESDNLALISESAYKVGLDFDILNKALTRFAITTKGAFDVKTMLNWTENLVKAGRAAGTTNQELRSGLLQLSQAMSAGRLMGDEYRSISENMPIFKQALEAVFEEMGRGDESLKELAQQGEITTEILIKGFGKLEERVDEFGDTWNTIDAAISRLNVEWQLFVYQLTKGSNVFKDIVNSFARALKFTRESIFGNLSNETEELVLSGKELVATMNDISEKTNDISNKTKEYSKSISEMNSTVAGAEIIVSNLFMALTGTTNAIASSTDEVKKATKEISIWSYALVAVGALMGAGISAYVLKFGALITGLSKGFSLLVATLGFASSALIKTSSTFQKAIKIVKIFGSTIGIVLLRMTGWIGIIASVGVALGLYIAKLIKSNDVQEQNAKSIKTMTDQLDDLVEVYSKLDSVSIYENMNAANESFHRAYTVIENLKTQMSDLTDEYQSGRIGTKEYNFQMSLLQTTLENANKQLVAMGLNMRATKKAFEETKGEALGEFFNFTNKLSESVKNKDVITYANDLETLNNQMKLLKDSGLDSEKVNKRYAEGLQNIRIKHSKLFNSSKESISKLTKDEKLAIKIKEELVSSFDKYNKAISDAERLMKKGLITEKQFNEYKKEQIKNTKAYKDEIESATKKAEEYTKQLDFELRHLKEANPLLADYVMKVNELSTKKQFGKITQEEYNKALEREQVLLKEGLNKELSELAMRYDEVAAAQVEYNQAESDLKELRDNNIISLEKYNDLLLKQAIALDRVKAASGEMSEEDQFTKGLSAGLYDFANNSKSIFEEMEELTSRSFNSMTDELTEFVTTGKADFGSLVDSIVKDLTRIAIQKSITEPLADALFGSLGGGLGSVFGGGLSTASTSNAFSFGGMTSLLGSANGNVFDSGNVVPFANGGIVNSPTFLPLAGEAGPEAIMPLKRDSSGKLGVEGGGNTINITINVQGTNGDSEAMRRSANQIAQAAGNATRRAMRRNG